MFDSVLFPIFDYVRHAIEPSGGTFQGQGLEGDADELDQDAWLYETCTLALQLVVDLFVNFYDTVGPLLRKVLSLLTSFIKRPHQSLAGIGIAAFVRLMSNAGALFSEDKWLEVVLSLKDATASTLPDFSPIGSGMYDVEAVVPGAPPSNEDANAEDAADSALEGRRLRHLQFTIADIKCRAAVQLLLIQVRMRNPLRPVF